MPCFRNLPEPISDSHVAAQHAQRWSIRPVSSVGREGMSCEQERSQENGAARGIRTPDPVITNDVLYQLSYCGDRGRVMHRPKTLASDIDRRADWQEPPPAGPGNPGCCAQRLAAFREFDRFAPSGACSVPIESEPKLEIPATTHVLQASRPVCRMTRQNRMTISETSFCSKFLFERDLSRKPVSPFGINALSRRSVAAPVAGLAGGRGRLFGKIPRRGLFVDARIVRGADDRDHRRRGLARAAMEQRR